MQNTLTKINCLTLVKDCLCENIIGSFYNQLSSEILTAFLFENKVIIHTCHGTTVIESGLEPSKNIVDRLLALCDTPPKPGTGISIRVGYWEIIAMPEDNVVYITQK